MLTAFILWVAKNTLKRIWPNMDIGRAQTIVILIMIGIVMLFVIWFGFKVVGWFRGEPKVDLETVQKINDKNEAKRDAALEKLVVENQEVLDTVDGRSAISELDIVTKQREVDRKVDEVSKKIDAVKSSGRDVTQEQLKCLLTRPVEECEQ